MNCGPGCVESAWAWPVFDERTGITIHDPVGCLYLAPHRDRSLEAADAIGRQFGLSHQVVSGAGTCAGSLAWLQVPDGVAGVHRQLFGDVPDDTTPGVDGADQVD